MRVIAADAVNSVIAQVAKRWQALDPLLPAPEPSPPGAGLVVVQPDGRPEAIGSCDLWEGTPGSLDLSWGAARRYQLSAAVAGPDVGRALDRLLAQWHDHLAGLPGTDQADTAAVVRWPSRDIDGVAALLRHRFAPLAVIAARTTRHPAGHPRARQDVGIRRAGPADLDTVAHLGLELVRYDAHFGGVIERPVTADALRRDAAEWLAEPDPWIWLAERDGTAIGMLSAERPASAAWIAPLAGRSPVAYVKLMIVLPAERGTGVGTALLARLNREIEAAGVAVTLLHYAQLNPLSAPFWSQHGYRPLWTMWETRPAQIT